MKSYSVAIAAGSEFIVTMVACLFLGKGADWLFGTKNIFILVGTILGFVLSVWRLTVTLKKIMDKPEGPG